MKNRIVTLALSAALVGLATPAMATTIDFESTAAGSYSSLVIGDATITFTAGTGTFDVDAFAPSTVYTFHNSLLSFFTNPGPGAFRIDFSSAISSFTIGVGDHIPSDSDNVHLRAYDAANALLASDDYLIGGSEAGRFLSVAAGSIAYVTFFETGDFEGAVYWDNISYDAAAVPEPGTLVLLGTGAVALLVRRKLSK